MSNEEKSFQKAIINWFPGHMAKTKREIKENLKLVDVVVEMVDARIPASSSNPDIEGMLRGKEKIKVLNKEDLADKGETKRWINYYKDRGVIALIANSQQGQGINNIREVLREFLGKQKRKSRLAVMVVGIPNVGKSAFINKIVKRRKAKVENRPGVTRQKQWVKIEEGIELMDTPGVLWPKLGDRRIAEHLAFTGAIKDKVMDMQEIACRLLLELRWRYREELEGRYKLRGEDVDLVTELELMELIGKNRGMLMTGGKVDLQRTAENVMEEFRSGKIGRISLERVEEIR